MSPHASFLLQDQIVPRLKSIIPHVNCVGAEDPEELVQDATAFAANMMNNAERAGKKVVRTAGARGGARKARSVSAGNIAYFTIEHIRSGRRSTGSSVADVYGSGTQLKGRSRLTSLEEVAATGEEGNEIFNFHDVLASDQDCPATRAARRIDWAEFWSGLSRRERVLIEFMIAGKTFKEVGQKCKICYSTIQASKRDLASKLLDFMGTDILIEVRRLPQWKQDLQIIREKMECREQRRHP
jgi:DNA-binding CsgD family transcriptional regulator